MRRYLCLCMLIVLVLGCDERRKPRVKPDTKDDTIIITNNATYVHHTNAAARAHVYEQIAEGVASGQLKTVNDVVNFSTPLFNDIAKKYYDQIDTLRKDRLHGADDQLPSDAADVFRLFAKEYEKASK